MQTKINTMNKTKNKYYDYKILPKYFMLREIEDAELLIGHNTQYLLPVFMPSVIVLI